MQIQTHILSGWCVADLLELTPRERVLAMVAATAPDLDGLGLLGGIQYYVEYHHVLAHNVLLAALTAALLAAFSTHRLRVMALCFGLFHLHLLLDYYGSGRGWPILYFWPFSDRAFQSPHAWGFNSWQNLLALALLIGWTLAILFRKGRSPLEVILPSLEGKVVRSFNRRARPGAPAA